MSRASDRDRAWQELVAFLSEGRDDLRRRMSEAAELPFSRVRALRRVGAKPMTLRDLAEALGTDAPAATVLVNDLEARGLVVRETHPDDRRAKLVSLTTEGKRLMRAVRAAVEAPPTSFDALDARDLADLARVLAKLRSGS